MGGYCASYTGSRGLCFRRALFVAGDTERDFNLRRFRSDHYGPGNSGSGFRTRAEKRAAHDEWALRPYPPSALSWFADHGGKPFTGLAEVVDCPDDSPKFSDYLCAPHAS